MPLIDEPIKIEILRFSAFAYFPTIGEKIAEPRVSNAKIRATCVPDAPMVSYAMMGSRNATKKNPRLQTKVEL